MAGLLLKLVAAGGGTRVVPLLKHHLAIQGFPESLRNEVHSSMCSR
jgi:hypothetical protein